MQGRSPEEGQRDGLPEDSSYSVQTNSCPHALLLSPNITMKCKNDGNVPAKCGGRTAAPHYEL